MKPYPRGQPPSAAPPAESSDLPRRSRAPLEETGKEGTGPSKEGRYCRPPDPDTGLLWCFCAFDLCLPTVAPGTRLHQGYHRTTFAAVSSLGPRIPEAKQEVKINPLHSGRSEAGIISSLQAAAETGRDGDMCSQPETWASFHAGRTILEATSAMLIKGAFPAAKPLTPKWNIHGRTRLFFPKIVKNSPSHTGPR